MASTLKRLSEKNLISPPKFLEPNLALEVIMGSQAYGCADPDKSDYDIRGVFLPLKVHCFPATEGLVVGFDDLPKCEKWQQDHIKGEDKEYDFDLHSLAHFLRLSCMNAPNQIELLWADERLITHINNVGRHLRDHREMFLSKLCWERFRGYAVNQYHKVKNKKAEGNRVELIERYGYDVKFAYNAYRLLVEAKQILVDFELDLSRYSGTYRSIRAGEWSLEEFEKEFLMEKAAVERAYQNCKLPEAPDHDAVRRLLFECLEMHYGSLDKAIRRPDKMEGALLAIRRLVTVGLGE